VFLCEAGRVPKRPLLPLKNVHRHKNLGHNYSERVVTRTGNECFASFATSTINNLAFDTVGNYLLYSNIKNRDSSVGIGTGYGLDGQDYITSEGKRSSLLWLWCPPAFQSTGTGRTFRRGKAAGA
jgi:hypothetical protein